MAVHDPIKAYDARWEVEAFDDAAVTRLFEATYAYGRGLGVDTVVLMRDGRLAAPHVQQLALEEGKRQGLRVLFCPDPVSTPQSYFAALWTAQEHPGVMSLMITASHNASGYIGVKFTVPVARAIGLGCGPEGGLTQVREIYHSGERVDTVSGGSEEIIDLTAEYVDWSLQQAGVQDGELSGLRVVLEGLHGSAGPELRAALVQAGIDAKGLRLVPDGSFPAGTPNPTIPERMRPAIELAGSGGYDVVIGLDGDGDRLVFGDRRGIFRAGIAAMAILRGLGFDSAEDGRRTVLHDPQMNPLAFAQWAQLGVRPALFRNGHAQIKDHMTRIGAAAGVEESGHYYHPQTVGAYTAAAENPILTSLLFLRMVRQKPDLLEAMWQLQDAMCMTGEFNFEFPNDSTRDEAIAAVVKRMVDDGADAVTTVAEDVELEGTLLRRGVLMQEAGVRLEPGWYSGFVRASATEKGVARAFFSGERDAVTARLREMASGIFETEFGGRPVD